MVTKFGVAQLHGKSAKQRVCELIRIARTDSRAGLIEQAERMPVYCEKKGKLTDLTPSTGSTVRAAWFPT